MIRFPTQLKSALRSANRISSGSDVFGDSAATFHLTQQFAEGGKSNNDAETPPCFRNHTCDVWTRAGKERRKELLSPNSWDSKPDGYCQMSNDWKWPRVCENVILDILMS